MADDTTTPIVAPDPATDQASALVRTLILSVSVVTAVAGLVSKRDLAGFINYVQSADFLAWLALILAAGTTWWGQMKARKRAKQIQAIRDDERVPPEVVQ